VRRLVGSEMCIRDSSSSIPVLTKILGDKNKPDDIRATAAYALAEISDSTATPALIGIINDVDERKAVLSSAATALGIIGDTSALPALIQLLGNKDEDVWSSSADALGRIGDHGVISVLLPYLNHENSYLKRHALSALGKIGNKRIIPDIVKLLSDEKDYVRRAAIDALREIADPDSIPALTKQINNEKETENVRESAIEALGNIADPAAIAALIQTANSNNTYLKGRTAYTMGLTGDPTVIPSLTKLITDQSEFVKLNTIDGLRGMNDPQVASILLQVFDNKESTENTRIKAIEVLGNLGDAELIPELLLRLSGEKKFMQTIIRQSINQIEDSISSWSGISQYYIDDRIQFEKKKSEDSRYGKSSEFFGKLTDKKEFLSVANTKPSVERNHKLLTLIKNQDIHHDIRRNSIYALSDEDEQQTEDLLNTLPTIHIDQKLQKHIDEKLDYLKQETRPPFESLLDTSLKLSIRKNAMVRLAEGEDKVLAKKSILQIATENESEFGIIAYSLLGNLQATEALKLLEKRLQILDKNVQEWRAFRDTERDNFTEQERTDFLQELQMKKTKLNEHFAYNYGYTITRIDPERGMELLSHNLADVRRGAYSAFAAQANIAWLEKLDTERNTRNNADPIFRHEAFRAIDLGLRRLEVLGKQPEIVELKAWQTKIKGRKMPSGDPDDEVYERLEWTTMMMDRYKDLEIQFKKEYDMVREWPEEETVNQPYPTAGANP
jgi:HEAT repeat protein